MRFGYLDPPYPGQARKHYAHDPRCAEVDHKELIVSACRDFPDGWALSTGSVNLHHVLPLCPADVRIGAWVKTFGVFKPNVNPAYVWEPVIFRGGRKQGRDVPTVRDWIACSVTLRRGLVGAKPEAVCWWIFDMLGMQRGDELHDAFPGSGAVTRAWASYKSERLFGVSA